MDMIFCYGGNKKTCAIAVENGWLYGSQPTTTYTSDISFVDLDFKKLGDETYIAKYLRFVKRIRPKHTVLPDAFTQDDLKRIYECAESLAEYTQNFIVVPKFSGCVERLPEMLYGNRLIFGYSVPTRYGGTSVPLWEFLGKPVHLLGGSPKKQRYLLDYLDVVSLDGNYCSKIAGYGWYISDKDLSESRANASTHWLDLVSLSLKNISTYYKSEDFQ